MTVAELGVALALVFGGVCATKGVVLLRNMLGEIRRDHLLDLLRFAGLSFLCLFDCFALEMSRALGGVLMVVALHQGGVRVGRSTHDCIARVLGTPGFAAALRGVCGRLRTIAFGCDSGNRVGDI